MVKRDKGSVHILLFPPLPHCSPKTVWCITTYAQLLLHSPRSRALPHSSFKRLPNFSSIFAPLRRASLLLPYAVGAREREGASSVAAKRNFRA
jgi:hypothetical protein